MARCPPERLADLRDVLAALRRWPGVVERSPAVFYVGRRPFLHFHLTAGGGRRADVKGPDGWRSIALPDHLTAARRRLLLGTLRAAFPGGSGRPPRASTGTGAPAAPASPPTAGGDVGALRPRRDGDGRPSSGAPRRRRC